MGCAVSTLAFPAPPLSSELVVQLYQNPDFLFLKDSHGRRIAAVHIRAKQKRTILFSHGNCEDLTTLVPFLQEMSEFCKANVFAYDYCGYGLSSGRASEEGCYAAINAAYKYVQGLPDCGQLVPVGLSIGTGPTVDLVHRHPEVDGMVLVMPLESAVRTVRACGYGLSKACYSIDIFRNYEKIMAIKCPVLVVHGTSDIVVPFEHGRRLHNACEGAVEPFWIDGGTHDEMPVEDYMLRMKHFLDGLVDHRKGGCI